MRTCAKYIWRCCCCCCCCCVLLLLCVVFFCVFRVFFLGGGFRHCYQPKRRTSRILCGQQHNYPDFATVGASCCSIAAKRFCVQRRAGLRVPQQQLRRCQQCCSIPDRCWPIPLLGVSSFSSLYNNWYKTGWPFSFNFLSILFLVGLLSFTFALLPFTFLPFSFSLTHALSLSLHKIGLLAKVSRTLC